MSLVHLLREPAGDAEGALVLNHGRGTDEGDLHTLLEVLDPSARLLGITPGAPHTDIPPGGRHWYRVPRVGFPDPETFRHSYALLTAFLDETLQAWGIGWERTVVGGFSMGAVMSYAVGLGAGRPSPAGILAMSGFIPTVEGWTAELDGRQGLSVLIHHGRNDPVIEVGFGRAANETLKRGGIDVAYHETDAGHWVPPELLGEFAEFVDNSLSS
ncbi:MAG: alpha/beta hydrolase [Solirubrobacterales bacterium]